MRFWAEILHKLAIPLLTVFGTMLTLVINERNNTRATLNQREQAESELRSNMFSELVNPLIEQSKFGEPQAVVAPASTAGAAAGAAAVDPVLAARADRLTLLGELLALNFHEHFELGPLLRYVDTLPGQTEDARSRLRATAGRVISRQLAPMLAAVDLQRPAAIEQLHVVGKQVGVPVYSDISRAAPHGEVPRGAGRWAMASGSTPNSEPPASPAEAPMTTRSAPNSRFTAARSRHSGCRGLRISTPASMSSPTSSASYSGTFRPDKG